MSKELVGEIVDAGIRMAVGGPALAPMNENVVRGIGEFAGKVAGTVSAGAKSLGEKAGNAASAVATAVKKLKNADAQRIQYGKLFNNCDFSGETFSTAGAVRFKGAKIAEAISEAKSDLNNLSATFEKLAKAYEEIINKCGTTSVFNSNTKLEDDNEFGKFLKKYIKSLKNRAKYCKDRAKTLQKILDVANIDTINISTAAQRAIEAANNATSAAEQDN